MTRQNVVKLTATGLRTLIREEVRRVRSSRTLHEENKFDDIDFFSPEGKPLNDAIEELTGVCLDMIYGDDIGAHDGAHPEVHNDILACVEKIFNEYGSGDEEDVGEEENLHHRSVGGDGRYDAD